jgi:hypothetical protein
VSNSENSAIPPLNTDSDLTERKFNTENSAFIPFFGVLLTSTAVDVIEGGVKYDNRGASAETPKRIMASPHSALFG